MTRSEDEMAGVLAHEMGHIAAHHEAIRASDEFRQVLGITQVGGKDDIAARWNQLLSNWRREKMTHGAYGKAQQVEDREQGQADAIALFLMSRSGYSPAAFVALSTGSHRQRQYRRLLVRLLSEHDAGRQAAKAIIAGQAAMPASCIALHSQTSADFERWKKSVIDYSSVAALHPEALPGLVKKLVLTERLRQQIENIRISPDGKYVLAQDDSNVFVLTRDPFKSVFRFDAPDAAPAQFSPDSSSVLLLFASVGASPRVERWDIASQKRSEAHEIYVRAGCDVSSLSPDGKTLVCATPADAASFALDLLLFDVQAETSFWEKKNFVSLLLSRTLRLTVIQGEPLLQGLIQVAFSADGHYLVAHARENAVAMDLSTRSPVNMPGSVRSLLHYQFTFLADGHLLGVAGNNGEKSTNWWSSHRVACSPAA